MYVKILTQLHFKMEGAFKMPFLFFTLLMTKALQLYVGRVECGFWKALFMASICENELVEQIIHHHKLTPTLLLLILDFDNK